jgi:hypothetical protein
MSPVTAAHNDPILRFAEALGGRVAIVPDWQIPSGQSYAVMNASYCVEACGHGTAAAFAPVTPACSSVRELRDHCATQLALAQQRAMTQADSAASMAP